MADFVPSVPYEALNSQINSYRGDGANATSKPEQRYVGSSYSFFSRVEKIHLYSS